MTRHAPGTHTVRRPILEVGRRHRLGHCAYGWYGHAIAPPGHDLYYLNGMSGSGDANVWKFSDEPSSAWIRDTWADLDLDPRVL